MSTWSKVYLLEGIADFYADDDFEEAIQVASDNTDDLSVKLRITVEPASEPTIADLHARIAELEAGLKKIVNQEMPKEQNDYARGYRAHFYYAGRIAKNLLSNKAQS